jgi:predicted regulator of Ras-like GTPase activity (Roadblock/LC7/MglB family)
MGPETGPETGARTGTETGAETGMGSRVGQLDWLLDDLVRRVAHITKAVILSQDGMALGASQTLGRDDAEHLAALAAGFQSLARGTSRHFGGGAVRQTVIEMESGFLLVTAAGSGTCLAVITGPGADLGLVAYEMAVLVRRSGEHIRVNTRATALSGWD